MLDKTNRAATGLRNFTALERAHDALGNALARIVYAAGQLHSKVASIHEYTKHNRAEVLGSSKTCRLQSGGTIAYQTIPGRMSCGDDERQKLFDLLKAKGLHGCINYNPSLNESALQEEFANNPSLEKELKKEIPSFKMGEAYEQLTLTFAGQEWKIKGNTAKGEYLPVPPDKKKKSA